MENNNNNNSLNSQSNDQGNENKKQEDNKYFKNVAEYNNKHPINWNGLFAYAQWLRNQKDKSNDNKILYFLNYFLLSPNLLEPESLKYYYDTLSQLSLFYCQANNIHGLDWVYHSFIRTQRTHQRASLDIQAKIFYRYAYLLNSRDVFLSFAYKLLNEIDEILDPKMKEEHIKLKDEIIHKIIDRNYDQTFQIPPFERNKLEEEDDYWNPLLGDYDKSVEVYNNGNKHQYGGSKQKKNFFDEFDEDEDNILNQEDENIGDDLDNSNNLDRQIKKKKVLILTSNENIPKVPFIPRYIHYKSNKDFKQILVKVGITDFQNCFLFREDKSAKDLLYIVYSFLNENKLLYFEQVNIDNFISNEDNDDSILIIASNIKTEEINAPMISNLEPLKPFLDFSFTLKHLFSKKGFFNGTPIKHYGNTCYMNSGLQCIFQCDLLTKYFEFDRYAKYYKTDNIIVQTFTDLVRNCGKENVGKFIKSIQNEFKKYKTNQNDSPELVTDILNVLGSKTCRAKYELHDYSMYPKDSGEMLWEKFLSKESSIITDLFYGQLKNQHICNCGETVKYEEFLLLDVPIPSYLINFKLFRLNQNNKFESICLDYHVNKDLRCVFIKHKVKEIYRITIDVLKIDIAKNKIKIFDDEDIILDAGWLSKPSDNYVEVLLYEKRPEPGITYYLVPCFEFKPKKKIINQNKLKPEIIVNYPIPIFVENNNLKNSTHLKEVFNDGFTNYERINETSITNKKLLFNHELFDLDQVTSIELLLKKLKHQKSILYFESKDIKFSVNISQSSILQVTIDHCLQNLCNPKTVTKCEQCNTNKEIRASFSKLPHYLILYIQRFYFDRNSKTFKKDRRKIQPLETITLEDNDHNEYTYNAFAIDLHKGKNHKGHYYAKCKDKEGWIKLKDGHPVKKTELELSSNIVLIFYERQEKKN